MADRPRLVGRLRRFADSLTGRTVALSVLVALIAAAVTLLVSYPLIAEGARAQSQANLDRLADVAVAAVRRPADDGTLDRLRSEFESAGVTAYLVGAGLPPAPGLSPQVQAEVVAGSRLSGTVTVAGEDLFVAARPVDGRVGLVLTTPVATADNIAGDDLRRLVAALLVGLAAAVLIGLLASGRVTRPLRGAARAAERMSAGERGLRLTPAGPAEVVEIADSLNRLSDSLAVSEARQREFLLSVSHELRTPLTAIRGYAEAMSDGLVADVPATGAVLAAESARMDRLVADLLDLARLGAVGVAIEPVEVDLAGLGRRAAQVWRDRCVREGVVFRDEIPAEPVVVSADPVRVRQIIDNLAENALRVTPAGSPIVLSVQRSHGYGMVAVRDGGPGLTDDDMSVAFEPAVLYGRYRGVRPVGSGVGLALVGRLAARMGGAAQAWRAPEGGAALGVWLPTADDSVPQGGRG